MKWIPRNAPPNLKIRTLATQSHRLLHLLPSSSCHCPPRRYGVPHVGIYLQTRLFCFTAIPGYLSSSELFKPCNPCILTRKSVFQHTALAQDLSHLLEVVWVTMLPHNAAPQNDSPLVALVAFGTLQYSSVRFRRSSQVPQGTNDEYRGTTVLVSELYKSGIRLVFIFCALLFILNIMIWNFTHIACDCSFIHYWFIISFCSYSMSYVSNFLLVNIWLVYRL